MSVPLAVLTLLAWLLSMGPPFTEQTALPFQPVALATSYGDVGPNVPVLTNLSSAPNTVEVELTASVTRLSLIPGATTEVYAYNERVPGPTLEIREGDRVIVHFRNDLPESTTVHWHGIHLPFDADGSPFHPVEPGESRIYEFTVRPGTAGTYWYHPHPHHHTSGQVARGLFGGIIVRAPDDPLPASLAERLLILSDNRFDPDGSLDLADPHSPQGRVDFENGREGGVLFVNGAIMPTLTIRSGEVQRWQIVNASAGRFYWLAIPGHTFLHVGSDGGLFEKPVEVEELLLATAERVELLVRGTAAPSTRAVLTSLPYDRYIRQNRPADWDQPRDLLTLQYTDQSPAAPTRLPVVLRPIPVLYPADATNTRVMVMSQGFINGRAMDMERVDEVAELGATEIWELENIVGMDHPFHLHGFQFQVLDRNGVPEPFRSWKDTVNVPRHQTVRFIVRYDNYPGRWMSTATSWITRTTV
ncbi:multicopper oxidase family protein [soil metagenome]|nr:multicopper oxidase family protein [Gemmatimonadota bacterium]